MPFGPYEDFDACLIDQKAKGHGEESARRICGSLQAELEGRAKKMGVVKIPGSVKSLDQYSRSVTILASTPAPAGDQPAITSWDLERFLKNPVILFNHGSKGYEYPIGKATEIEETPEGLKLRVVFASEKASPLAEQVYQGICEDIIRAVSVGYELVGKNRARLLETSFVPIGLDEDAGVEALNPEAVLSNEETKIIKGEETRDEEISVTEDEARERAARAASTLAKHRTWLHKVKRSIEEENERIDAKDPARHAAKVASGKAEIATAKAKSASEHAAKNPTDKDAQSKHESAQKEAVSAHKEAASAWKAAASEAKPGSGKELTASSKVTEHESQGAVHEAATGGGGGGGGAGGQSRDELGRFDSGEIFFRADTSRLGKAERTQIGGARIPSTLSRVGVLTYVNPDGTRRRELRLPDEVFNDDSLRTLEHAPVIDIRDHTGMVTPDTWKRAALGSVINVRRDGKFISGDLLIQDGNTLDAIDDGDRTEISLGYQCKLDWTPGVYEGEHYDCIQRCIQYNHAALCPPNRGRAGPEVGLRLDNKTVWGVSRLDEGEETMAVKIRLDNRDYEEGSREHLDAVERIHKIELDKVRVDSKAELDKVLAKVGDETKRAETAEGRADAAEAALTKDRTDAAAEKSKREEAMKDKEKSERNFIRARLRLIRSTVRYFSDDDDDEDENDEEMDTKKKGKRSFPPEKDADKKYDSFENKLIDMSDRDIMLLGLKKSDPHFDANDADGKPRSDDYVRARFDAAVEQAKRARGVDGVVREVEKLKSEDRTDAGELDQSIEAARKRRDKWAYDAGRNPQNGGGQ